MKIAALVLALILAAPAYATEKHLATPPLSSAAREIVHQKMADHSKGMTELVWAVVFLDFQQTAALAKSIATEPRLARPLTQDATELNSALSPRFFVLQDQLRARAQRLEAAARSRDSAAMARAYGAIAETCVACHDAYLASH
jgi:cytochrome c556